MRDIKVGLLSNVCKRNSLQPQEGLEILRRKGLEQCPKCKERTVQEYTGSDCLVYDCLNCDYTTE